MSEQQNIAGSKWLVVWPPQKALIMHNEMPCTFSLIVLTCRCCNCCIVSVLPLFQSTEFYAACADRGLRGIPQVWGAIDCTHIRITKPKDSGAQYVDRKSDYSILMQAVCDAQGVFQDVEVGDSGRTHDATMLRYSKLGKVGAPALLPHLCVECFNAQPTSYVCTGSRHVRHDFQQACHKHIGGVCVTEANRFMLLMLLVHLSSHQSTGCVRCSCHFLCCCCTLLMLCRS